MFLVFKVQGKTLEVNEIKKKRINTKANYYLHLALSPMMNHIYTFHKAYTIRLCNVWCIEAISHPDVFVIVGRALWEDGNYQNIFPQLPFYMSKAIWPDHMINPVDCQGEPTF